MLLDCHLHTNTHSPCSSMEPEEMCRTAFARGIDAVVITEHNVQWRSRDLDALRAVHPGLTIYSGMEVWVAEGYDVAVIAANVPPLPAMPSFSRLISLLSPVREDVFVFVAHPFRYVEGMTEELQAIFKQVDGIEMNSVNILRGGWERDGERFLSGKHRLYQEARQRFGLVGLYNTDSHHAFSVGTIANLLEGETLPEGEAELAALLKGSRPVEHQNPKALAACLEKFSRR
jgi:hypothetical protein